MAYETVLVYISPPCFRGTNTMQALFTFSLKRYEINSSESFQNKSTFRCRNDLI
jgi:hypothetical protein